MGGSIPYSIRSSVIKQWLEGLPRDQIAKVNQIATGTVSAIVKGCKEPDPEFILLREVAVILNQHRLDLALFSPLIRLGRLIGKMNTTEEEIEQFLENIDIHCFKKGVEIQEFIRTINEVSELSKKFGVPLGKLPEHLIGLRAERSQLNAKIQAMKIQEREALKRFNLTLEIINEYQREKPVVDRLKATQIERNSIKKDLDMMAKEHQMEIAKVKKQRDYFKLELNCRNDFLDQYGYNLEWGIPEEELDLANEELSRNLEPIDLKNMLMEIYYSPSKYTDILAMILKRFPSLDLKKKTNEVWN
jgi:hypothetical protein